MLSENASTKARVRLTVLQPQVPPSALTFATDEKITVGRSEECQIHIRDRFLSRRHAEIAWSDDQWVLRDCGSVNGTHLNGRKLSGPATLKAGDRIGFGDVEVLVEDSHSGGQLVAVDSGAPATALAIPIHRAVNEDSGERAPERARILNELALQFIEDRPMNELFDFILERVHELLSPSRAALALFGSDRSSFANVKVRHAVAGSGEVDLTISRTLLDQVVEERKVISFTETDADDRLARAVSMIAQQIRAAVCAPLIVNDQVLGVLYVDFQASHRTIVEGDLRLVAQIARFAAAKLETTRLREEAEGKARIDEELRLAYGIQSRLLPDRLPDVGGYTFSGVNRPCKTVSGDYYDVVVRPDGKIYFIVADISGKGITASLIMAALATAFIIFTRTDPSPADLARELNQTLAPKTAPSKFATVFLGVLDPATGVVEFTNAGHVPPLVVTRSGVSQLTMTDMVIGLFPAAPYRTQTLTLGEGDSLVMFTDGITEAEDEGEAEFGIDPVTEVLIPLYGTHAAGLVHAVEARVQTHVGSVPFGDDVTLLAIARMHPA